MVSESFKRTARQSAATVAECRWHRSRLVDVALRILFYSGLLHVVGLIRKYLGRRRLLVLMYHRLSSPEVPATIEGLEGDEAVPVGRFDAHLRLLRWFGEPLALDEGYGKLVGESSGPRSFIAVTFDDGYRDNYLLGLPVWTKYRIPVTIFPALAVVNQERWLWWDELLRIVGRAKLNTEHLAPLLQEIRSLVGESATEGGLPEISNRTAQARYLFKLLNNLPVELRDHLIHTLAHRLDVLPAMVTAPACCGVPDRTRLNGNRLYMNWNELQEQSSRGVRLGGHTIRHPWLPLESGADAEREIRDCRAILEERLGRPVTCFAYPGGYYGDRELDLLGRAGYRVAVTVEKGANYPDTHPLRLRRIAISYDGAHHLAFKLAFCDWIFK